MKRLYTVVEVGTRVRRTLLTTPDLEHATTLAKSLMPPPGPHAEISGQYEVIDEDGMLVYPAPPQTG